MVIEMAKRKGMIDSPVVKDTRNFANESTKEVFDEWDNNNDGFVDHEEVSRITYSTASFAMYVKKPQIYTFFKNKRCR